MKSIGVLAFALAAGLTAATPAAAKGAYASRQGGLSFHMTFGTVQVKQVRGRAYRAPRHVQTRPVYRYSYRPGRRAAPSWAHPAWRRAAWPGYGWWRHWHAPSRHTHRGHRHR